MKRHDFLKSVTGVAATARSRARRCPFTVVDIERELRG
jgi:hypothetical protein